MPFFNNEKFNLNTEDMAKILISEFSANFFLPYIVYRTVRHTNALQLGLHCTRIQTHCSQICKRPTISQLGLKISHNITVLCPSNPIHFGWMVKQPITPHSGVPALQPIAVSCKSIPAGVQTSQSGVQVS